MLSAYHLSSPKCSLNYPFSLSFIIKYEIFYNQVSIFWTDQIGARNKFYDYVILFE